MEIPFTKMHGLGNNYIYIDLFSIQLHESWFSPIAKAVANVNTGIGSDGLIIIHPSKNANLGMRIFNRDGSEGQSCGNGLRCTARYAYDHFIVDDANFTIETRAGIVQAHIKENVNGIGDITINMGKPLLLRKDIPMIGKGDDVVIGEDFTLDEEKVKITALFMGNPNAVIFVDDLQNVPLEKWGPLIEGDPRFPNRVNVEFAEIVNEREIKVAVWERGSGATQACGTGACAAVVASVMNGHIGRNQQIDVHLPGGKLQISWSGSNEVWMTGPATYIAKGTFTFDM